MKKVSQKCKALKNILNVILDKYSPFLTFLLLKRGKVALVNRT